MPGERGRQISRRRLIGAATLLLASPAVHIVRAAPREGGIRFGLTPVFLTSDLELLGRLQAYLERVTGRPVTLITRRTYQEITALLVSGELDAAWICGFPFVMHRTELDLVAVPVWRSRPLYQSYLIIDRSRAGRAIGDLEGGIHAFSDPDSNSGFLVTRAALAAMKRRPEEFFARTFFTYGHRNVIRAVASGLANSGSVDGYVYDVVAELEPALVADTRIVTRSEWLGFPPIAAPRHGANRERLQLLTDAFLGMHQVPDGEAVLRMLRLDRFSAGRPELFDAIAAKAASIAAAG